MEPQPQPQPQQQQQQPQQSPSSDNYYMPSMRNPITAPSTPKTLYELKEPNKTVLVFYFIDDDINTQPKVGTITEIHTFSMFGKKYTVKSGNDNKTENVNKVYTTDITRGTGDPVKVQEVVQVDARGGGRRRKSKKVFKNKNKNKNKKRNSRKSSKRSRRH